MLNSNLRRNKYELPQVRETLRIVPVEENEKRLVKPLKQQYSAVMTVSVLLMLAVIFCCGFVMLSRESKILQYRKELTNLDAQITEAENALGKAKAEAAYVISSSEMPTTEEFNLSKTKYVMVLEPQTPEDNTQLQNNSENDDSKTE